MSGIYGIVRFDGSPVQPEELSLIRSGIADWKCDEEGEWFGEGVGLGHLMLWETPEAIHETLPCSISSSPHLTITADARIDNRDDLSESLGISLQQRQSLPDSRLILLAYARWGEECPKHLLGDFAFVIWDSRERKLFCARDPFGCKPFVYTKIGDQFIFASDVRGVLAATDSPRLNKSLLAAYLQMKTYYAEKIHTFFERVLKLPAGHYLVATNGKLMIARHWSPPDTSIAKPRSKGDYVGELQFLLKQAVQCRLRSRFQVGSHLSGGLDSSAISVLAARALRDHDESLSVFSWSPPPRESHDSLLGEHARIEAVCQQEQLSCEYLPATESTFLEYFQRDITIEPTALMMREDGVQQRARRLGVRIMLSGWGGDEAASAHTSGYLAHFFLHGQWRNLRTEISSRAERSPKSLPWVRAGLVAMRDIAVPLLPNWAYQSRARRSFPWHLNPCIDPAFRHTHEGEMEELAGPAFRALPDFHETIRNRLDYGHVVYRIEHWAVSGARQGIVYRYPMLDIRLINFILQVPSHVLCGPEQRRSLFREAVATILPSFSNSSHVKIEPAAFRSLSSDVLRAYPRWLANVAANSLAPANRLIDLHKIESGIATAIRTQYLAHLNGPREALACFSIRSAPL